LTKSRQKSISFVQFKKRRKNVTFSVFPGPRVEKSIFRGPGVKKPENGSVFRFFGHFSSLSGRPRVAAGGVKVRSRLFPHSSLVRRGVRNQNVTFLTVSGAIIVEKTKKRHFFGFSRSEGRKIDFSRSEGQKRRKNVNFSCFSGFGRSEFQPSKLNFVNCGPSRVSVSSKTVAQIGAIPTQNRSKKVTFSSSRPLVSETLVFRGRKRMVRPCHSISEIGASKKKDLFFTSPKRCPQGSRRLRPRSACSLVSSLA